MVLFSSKDITIFFYNNLKCYIIMKKINKKIKSPQYFPLFCGYIYVGEFLSRNIRQQSQNRVQKNLRTQASAAVNSSKTRIRIETCGTEIEGECKWRMNRLSNCILSAAKKP